MTDKELSLLLEKEKCQILLELKAWPDSSANHKKVIEMLEGYKKLVKKYVRRYFNKEDPFYEFWSTLARSNEENSLKAANVDTIYCKRKQPHKSKSGTADTNEDTNEKPGKLVRQKVKKKAGMGKSKSIWAQLEPYFFCLSEEVKTSLTALLSPFAESTNKDLNASFLNMFAIDRLAAIAKMMQYCCDNKLTMAEFMEDRTYQKIKSRFKQQTNNILFTTPSAGDKMETMCCPALEEIEYLLSIGKNNLESTLISLKSLLFLQNTQPDAAEMVRKNELEKVSLQNRDIIKRLQQKMTVGNSETAKEKVVLMNCLGTVAKKRRKRTPQGNVKKSLKKHKTEDTVSEIKSTPKDFQMKCTPPQVPPLPQVSHNAPTRGVKFQILRSVVPFPSGSCRRNPKSTT